MFFLMLCGYLAFLLKFRRWQMKGCSIVYNIVIIFIIIASYCGQQCLFSMRRSVRSFTAMMYWNKIGVKYFLLL